MNGMKEERSFWRKKKFLLSIVVVVVVSSRANIIYLCTRVEEVLLSSSVK